MLIAFHEIRALSFDCYGTLIDWQAGILAVARPVLGRAGVNMPDAEIIRCFAEAERVAESGPYCSYKQIQREVIGALLGPAAADASDAALDALWRSIQNWPAFGDTPAALRRLQSRYHIAIASNIDDDLFAHSQAKLGIVPDVVVTAEQVRSYKPGRAHFDELMRRLALAPEQILHVGESRFHDVEPAGAMGFPTVWVNRQGGRSGGGDAPSASGTPHTGRTPDLVVGSLAELVDALDAA